jgi:elongation factor Ts
MSAAVISAVMVRDLREKTGAGMMECKKALEEAQGDMDKAVKVLREKGIASASKKAGRAAGEGLVGVKIEGTKGVLSELNCETDFVARTDQFKAVVAELAAQALKDAPAGEPKASAAALLQMPSAKNPAQKVEDVVKAAIAAMGENMTLSRVAKISVAQGVLGSYLHSDGKMATIVAIKCGKADSASKAEVVELAKDVAMQVAGNLPPAEVVSREQISPELVAREKDIAMNQARATGKPENIIEKIAEGKLSKVLQEITLLDQLFVKDPALTIAALVKQVGAKVGDSLEVEAFIRIKVGEASA